MPTTSTAPARTRKNARTAPRWTDRELLERGVLMARWDISHGREPSPECWQSATFGWVEVFGGIVDPISEELKDRALKEAISHGAQDTQCGDLDAELMDLFMQAVEQAFWLGLTRGDAILCGNVHLPYRLFPELRGAFG